jgi:hypothetical protein
MSDIPMKDLPETVVETVDENEDDHPERSMMGLVKQTLRTENPTVDPLTLNPDNLVDRTFLMPPKEDGTRVRAKIIKRATYKMALDDPDRAAEIAKFHCIVNDDYEDVVAYNDIVDYIEQDDHGTGMEIQGDPRTSAYNLVTQIIWDP